MRIGILGDGDTAAARAAAVAARLGADLVFGPASLVGVADLDAILARLDVAFVTVPAAWHHEVTAAAAKRGVHVLLDWPPAASLPECEAIVRLAEEAGVEVGISRPLRWMPALAERPGDWRASLTLLDGTVAGDVPAWPRHVADAADVCCALARSASIRRADAAAVRTGAAWPEAVAFTLRFHSGAYAQVGLRRGDATTTTVYAADAGHQLSTTLSGAALGLDIALEAETQAFLDALGAGQPAPVSILDGLQTMRLVERLMERLR